MISYKIKIIDGYLTTVISRLNLLIIPDPMEANQKGCSTRSEDNIREAKGILQIRSVGAL